MFLLSKLLPLLVLPLGLSLGLLLLAWFTRVAMAADLGDHAALGLQHRRGVPVVVARRGTPLATPFSAIGFDS